MIYCIGSRRVAVLNRKVSDKKVGELDADHTRPLFFFVLIYARNGRFIVTCVLYFR